MTTTILAWPLKRVAIKALQNFADGTTPPPAGAELLASTDARPVQVAFTQPVEPDRVCVAGTPVRATLRELTAESPTMSAEAVPLELLVRVFEPGEDIEGVNKQLADMCQAVVTAVLAAGLVPQGRIYLAAVAEDPPSVTAGPEPSVTMSARLGFVAEVVSYA